MISSSLITGCLVSLLGMGFLERRSLQHIWRSIPIRIHVNGIRGKSTVTRMIHSALCQAGIPALGKTTGTACRLLLPDGSEQAWPRRGHPNIREQIRLLRLAKKMRARAVVAECMAIQPTLQWVAEQEMMRSSIGVITNVRTDHQEVMGRSLEEIACSLSNSVPYAAKLVLGETSIIQPFLDTASKRQTEVILVDQAAGDPFAGFNETSDLRPDQTARPCWLSECRRIALAVSRLLSLDDHVALEGIRRANPDPGAAWSSFFELPGRTQQFPFLDAGAANDPESLLQILCDCPWIGMNSIPSSMDPSCTEGILFIYNHRADRPERLLAHLGHPLFSRIARHIWISGDAPCWSLAHKLRLRHHRSELPYRTSRELKSEMMDFPFTFRGVVFCGNTRGFSPREWAAGRLDD